MQRKKNGKTCAGRHPAMRLLGLLLAVMMVFQSLTPLEVKAASAALALTDSAGNNLANGATVTNNVAKIYFGTPNCYYRVFYGNGQPVTRDYEDVTGIKVLEIHPGGAEHLIEWFSGESVRRRRYNDLISLLGNTYSVDYLGNVTQTRSGNGILDIYTVSINNFNDWPQNILKRDGSTRSGWNYDIVCFGFNDANGVENGDDSVLVTYANGSTGRVTTKFLSPGGRDTMAAYLASGGGTVFGHDTIVNNYVQWGSYSNTGPERGDAYFLGYTPDANHFRELAGYCGMVLDDSAGPVISSSMTKKKSGLLTTYPFSMPDNMNVVSTHSLGQVANGADVWYTLDNSGTPYLMTFRNTAMTQAGHTAQSTMQRQEKLLLANTIFYVNQFLFSGDTVSVPDNAAPSAPTITTNGTNKTCSFAAEDNGTPYQLTGYLWEKNNTGNMWDNSTANYQTNTVTVNSKTGVAGYYYKIDQSASTVITPQTSGISSGGSNINIASYLTGSYYIHAIAVDKNGNYSPTATLKLSSQHTLVYDANGGTGAPASQTVVKGQTNTIPNTIPQRDGYTFKYWTTTPYDLTSDYHYGVVQSKDGPYIKRIWFNYINATTMEILVYAEGTETVKIPTWTTLNGQDDLVWHTLNKGTWTAGGQTFNFGGWINISDHNGEVGEYQHHVYAYDSKGNTLQSAAFRNHGFIYKPGATYAGYMNGGTQTLYAQWQPNTHTLVYDANGGTGAPGPQTIVKGQTNTISDDIPYYEGHTFKYWTTTPYDLTSDYHYHVVQPVEGNNCIKRVWFDYIYINPTTMEILVYAEGAETVKVPTWTTLNGQDDLVWHTLNKGTWTAGGQTFNFGGWIHISDHNGEVGEYKHHVYAYDSNGNELNSARFRNHGFIYSPSDVYDGYMNGGTQTLYAQWRANDNTEYKVEHYIMNKSDIYYSKAGDETQYGTAGDTVTVSDFISDTYDGNGFTYSHAEVGSTTVTETPIKADGSLVIRLYYTRNTSTLKVNPNGGTWKGSTDSQSFEQRYETTKQIDPPDEKTGYKFTGWTLTHYSGGNGSVNGNGENGGSITYTYGSKQNGVDTLKAGWSVINYTITYDLDGGTLPSGKSNPTSYTVNTETFNLNNPEKSGYTFAGWTGTGLSSATTTVTIAKGSTGNRSYKATWTKNQEPEPVYTVTLNEGTGIDSVTGAGSYHAGDTVTINATVSTGYTWKNWTGYSTQTTKQYQFTMPAQNISFTANATINSSTLKVNPNGGSWNGSTSVQSFTGNYGSEKEIKPDPTREGYTFAGWTLSSGANGSFNTSTKKYTYGSKSGTTDTLTATWSEVPVYTVTLNKGTGISSVTGGGTYKYGETVTINAVVMEGYTWKNWTGYSTQTTKQYQFTMPAKDVTFTANAVINSSTLKIDPNGGSWGGSTTVQSFTGNYGSVKDIPDPDERPGYNFNGWVLSGNKNGTYNSSKKKYTYGSKAGTTDVLTAQWSEGNVAYKVVHHTQNTDGSTYTEASTETKYGTTGSSITASALKSSTYDGNGFTYNHAKVGGNTVTSATIKADGSLVIDLYYDRNSYGYTVKHYFQNIANNEYTLVKSVDGTAFYNAKVTGVLLTDEQIVSIIEKSDAASGFTKPATSTVTITTDTSKNVISYYYSRNSFTLKLTSGTGISTVSGAGTYKYEAPVTIDATVKTGYKWKNWTDDNNSNSSVTETKKYTFTNGMPATAVAYTANATAHIYAIRYELNGGRLPDGKTNPETYTIESASFQLINPERTGYDFLGWTGTGLDGKTKDVTIAQGSCGDRTYSAEWEIHKYTIRFDGNGATEGSMADIEATYDIEMELPANGYAKENEYGMSTFLGWSVAPESRDVLYADQAVIKNLLNENGAVLTLYAVWDDCPGIEAKDLYYTLEQAQSGYITEMELLSHASASDMEDREILPGTHEDVGNSFRVMDYAESDFTQFVHSGSVTETYRVMDSSGNSYTEQITVYIVDTHPDTVVTISEETEKEGTTRFINEKYYALSLENGGLSKDSVWKADPEYSAVIERSFYNQRSGIPEQVFTFSHDEILQMKEFIQENGIGNLKSQDALQRFYQKFAP